MVIIIDLKFNLKNELMAINLMKNPRKGGIPAIEKKFINNVILEEGFMVNELMWDNL
jgi:hypothetical protein